MKYVKHSSAFALPTVLIVSVILLMLLTTGISATVAVNNGLRDQYYTKLAELASDAGTAFANTCFEQGGDQITWTDDNPLRPNTDCEGIVNPSLSGYVLDNPDVRTYFVVDTTMIPKGYTEAVRTTSGLAWRTWTTGSANAVSVPSGTSLPVGTYLEGAWTAAPEGYLLANGTCQSRTTYDDLYAVIGTTYNVGSTCTTAQFQLPNFSGRNSIGIDTADTKFDQLVDKGGEESHLLTIAEMPAHNHSINDPGHSHRQYVTANSGGPAIRRDYQSDGNGGVYDQGINTGGSGTGISINNNGGGTTHNVLDPYQVVTKVIKY